jgi:hypothetical protein
MLLLLVGGLKAPQLLLQVLGERDLALLVLLRGFIQNRGGTQREQQMQNRRR